MDITKIQICEATLGIVHKSFIENIPTSPQSFELSFPTEESLKFRGKHLNDMDHQNMQKTFFGAPRSGRPVKADKDAIKVLVDANQRITTQRNLPRRIDVCDSLLKRHEKDPFLKLIITEDEKGHGAKKDEPLKPFPKPIFTKKRTRSFGTFSLVLLDFFSNYQRKIEKSLKVGYLVALHFKYDQARRRFVEWAENEIAVVPDFHKRILFSDEAHFFLNGYVNKQNCRIWSEANPQVNKETPLHPEKLTVWCALWAGGIIGPYFFQNDEGHNELWLEQDGATCHTARVTIDLLKDTFGGRLISRFGPVNWPPRSCDLTPLDYFLWGYVKSLVYADKPQTLNHLEDNIHRVIADIRLQMLEKVIDNWTSRLDYIRASRGSHMPEIIFKM
ncbi:putative DD41D transposase [Trichonephila clavipes]|nr:putative DD41D transposase [Trichonephila clavipes]